MRKALDNYLRKTKFKILFCLVLSGSELASALDPSAILAAASCGNSLTQAREISLLRQFDRLEILREDPAYALPAEVLARFRHEVLGLVEELKPTLLALGYPTRAFSILTDVLSRKRDKLTIFATRDEIRQTLDNIYGQLNGLLFETLVANRLSAHAPPLVGRRIASLYPGLKWAQQEAQKELDVVLPADEDGGPIWIEAKLLWARPLFQAGLSEPFARKEVLRQLETMSDLGARLGTKPRLYLVVPVRLGPVLHQDIVARDVNVVVFPLSLPRRPPN